MSIKYGILLLYNERDKVIIIWRRDILSPCSAYGVTSDMAMPAGTAASVVIIPA